MGLIGKDVEDKLHKLERELKQLNIYLKSIAESQAKIADMQKKYCALFNKKEVNNEDDRK